MPPRWPRKPDRNDPAYRKLDDRMNFAVHVAAFAATNSGLWFFHTLQPQQLPWVETFTLAWAAALLVHGIYIFAIANYTSREAIPQTEDSPADSP